ncbi:MAG: Bax inhibitor-1/YccA family protein [Aggregatilineales bacterium]
MGFYNNRTDVSAAALDFPSVMRQVYVWMTLALLVTAGTAFVIAQTNIPLLLARQPLLYLAAFFVELGLVIFISARITKMAPATALALFLAFAVVNGITLSFIFLVYAGQTIMYAALAAGAMFGATSIIGYTTKIDLSRLGGILMMALIGLIIASFINFFVPSDTLFRIINYAGVLIFVGLTAFDTQRIKRMALNPALNMGTEAAAMTQRVAIMGALTLYLDMINLFLFLLRIMGGGGRGRR